VLVAAFRSWLCPDSFSGGDLLVCFHPHCLHLARVSFIKGIFRPLSPLAHNMLHLPCPRRGPRPSLCCSLVFCLPFPFLGTTTIGPRYTECQTSLCFVPFIPTKTLPFFKRALFPLNPTFIVCLVFLLSYKSLLSEHSFHKPLFRSVCLRSSFPP